MERPLSRGTAVFPDPLPPTPDPSVRAKTALCTLPADWGSAGLHHGNSRRAAAPGPATCSRHLRHHREAVGFAMRIAGTATGMWCHHSDEDAEG
jgi:hypothetical protein